MKINGWWDKLEQKAQAKEKKADLAGVKPKTTKVEWLEDELIPMTKANLLHSAYKKELEKAMFFGGHSHSSGGTAYFDQPSSWKPLPQGSNYYWKSISAVQSASAYHVGTNYTQVFPADLSKVWEPPMTIERAIALNDGVAA